MRANTLHLLGMIFLFYFLVAGWEVILSSPLASSSLSPPKKRPKQLTKSTIGTWIFSRTSSPDRFFMHDLHTLYMHIYPNKMTIDFHLYIPLQTSTSKCAPFHSHLLFKIWFHQQEIEPWKKITLNIFHQNGPPLPVLGPSHQPVFGPTHSNINFQQFSVNQSWPTHPS